MQAKSRHRAEYAVVLGSPELDIELRSGEWIQVLDAVPMGPDIRYRVLVHSVIPHNAALKETA